MKVSETDTVITKHGEGKVFKIEHGKYYVRVPRSPWPFPEVFVLERKEIELPPIEEAPY